MSQCPYCPGKYVNLTKHLDACRVFRAEELRKSRIDSKERENARLRIENIEAKRALAAERARSESLQRMLANKPTVVYNIQMTQNIVQNHNTLITSGTNMISEYIKKNASKYRGIDGARDLLRKTRLAAHTLPETRRLVRLLESKDISADIADELTTDADAAAVAKNMRDKIDQADKAIITAVVDNAPMTDAEKDQLELEGNDKPSSLLL